MEIGITFSLSATHLLPTSLSPCLYGICAIGSSITGVTFPLVDA